MSDVLTRICADKRAHVARAKAAVSEAALAVGLATAPPVRPFAAALEQHLAPRWLATRGRGSEGGASHPAAAQ